MGGLCKRRRCCVVFCGVGMVVAVFLTLFQCCAPPPYFHASPL